ncbi:hypothetical protein AAH174_24535 [Bacteroides thetaiotaomicron]
MFKPLKSVSVLLLLCAMPAAISYAASENGATSVNVTQQSKPPIKYPLSLYL